jgi:hypothetical protein
MEFPPEILAMIRAFYQPCFKYFREYKRVLRQAGLASWPLLKDALSHGDKILSYVLAYEKALIEWNKVSRRALTPYKHYFWGDQRLVLDELYKARRKEKMKTLSELIAAYSLEQSIM